MRKNFTKYFFSSRFLRPFTQGFFLLFFIVLFVRVSYPLKHHLTQNFFFNLDPLITLSIALSGTLLVTGMLASLIIVVITVLFGRVFCGWICPMGTILDLFNSVIPTKNKQMVSWKGRLINYKYYFLSFFLLGSLAGFSAVLFFDPLVLFFRFLTLNVYPVIIYITNGILNMIRPLANKMGAINLYMLSYDQPVYILGIINLLLFAAIVGLIYIERRFWCRNLCPLGALLSVLSHFSLWRRRVSDKCIDCLQCVRSCPMNAISENPRLTSLRECIQCKKCETVCPVNAISFEFGNYESQRFEFDPARRSVIFSGLGGILTGLTAAATVGAKTTHGALLRPPGSLIEDDFLDACLRCGECMKVCPTNALQPARLEAGFEGLFSPVIVPRIGGCEKECNLCGQVCPTGAVRKLPLTEKQYAVIGNAVIERNLCIAWEQLKLCLICDEVCPYDAVEFRMVTDEKGTLQRPFVIEDKCVGCGQCENGCPVNGPAAIHITPVNEVRKNNGSYITEKVKRLREVHDDDTEFYREYNLQFPEEKAAPQYLEQLNDTENDLPQGFVE